MRRAMLEGAEELMVGEMKVQQLEEIMVEVANMKEKVEILKGMLDVGKKCCG